MAKKRMRNHSNQNQENHLTQEKLNFNLRHINPLTPNQKHVFHSYENEKNLLLLGSPGTGKSFVSIYLALREILTENSNFKKLVIVRSAEPTKNVGFLPGNLKEKTKILEEPYREIVSELFERGDAYEYLKQKKVVDFLSTSYIRGITIQDSIVLVDECQNLQWSELYSIVTRVSDTSKVIFSGDYCQSDLHNQFREDSRKDDILRFANVIKKLQCFDTINFTFSDIIRNPMIKEFIITANELGYM